MQAATVVHAVFVALYSGDEWGDSLTRAAQHLNGTNVQFHALVNHASLRVPSWITQHPVSQMPAEVVEMHRNLSRSKTKGAGIFLWKPFLYHVLPIERAIVLDLDIVLVGGARLHGLWSQFEKFGPHTVFGIASEAGPSYARIARSAGVNGGVQLHHLERMRQSALRRADDSSNSTTWQEALRAMAAGEARGWDKIEPSLGDQTLYSTLCHRTPHLCHRLPCGWNRQLSTRYYTSADFVNSWHACTSRCHLLHFNQPLLEQVVPELQRPGYAAGCTECRHAMMRLENKTRASGSRNPKFSWGASKQHMARVVDGCCCPERRVT